MKLSLDDKMKIISLSERASDLLVMILDEDLPKERIPTRNDTDFQKVMTQIYSICPLMSDSYVLMYNHIQKQKTEQAGRKAEYMKLLRLDEEYKRYGFG